MDPGRTGTVSRMEFIAALERGGVARTMSPEDINDLADRYSSDIGLINYLACFRSLFGGNESLRMVKKISKVNNPVLQSPSKALKPLATHPWEFEYDKNSTSKLPYWKNCTEKPKDMEKYYDDYHSKLKPTPTSTQSVASLTTTERDNFMAKYKPEVHAACDNIGTAIVTGYRQIAKDFRKKQIKNIKGCITSDNFIHVLENSGCYTTKRDLGIVINAFRGPGVSDTVRYDDFMKFTLFVKKFY